MFCPFCQTEDTKVIDSRLVADGSQIRRRRSCEVCHSRFTTFETADLALPRVIKTNGERQPFNGSKLKKGMLRALEKRPLSTEEIDTVFGKILKEIIKPVSTDKYKDHKFYCSHGVLDQTIPIAHARKSSDWLDKNKSHKD